MEAVTSPPQHNLQLKTEKLGTVVPFRIIRERTVKTRLIFQEDKITTLKMTWKSYLRLKRVICALLSNKLKIDVKIRGIIPKLKRAFRSELTVHNHLVKKQKRLGDIGNLTPDLSHAKGSTTELYPHN